MQVLIGITVGVLGAVAFAFALSQRAPGNEIMTARQWGIDAIAIYEVAIVILLIGAS